MISLTPTLPADTRLFTVVGHFGSGKTEFAVNLALRLREERAQVALADLDVVDPYFRSRECEPLLAEKGIRLISSANTCRDADLPSMPAEVNVLLDNPGLTGVLDIGGDPSGARVLARYRRRLERQRPFVRHQPQSPPLRHGGQVRGLHPPHRDGLRHAGDGAGEQHPLLPPHRGGRRPRRGGDGP